MASKLSGIELTRYDDLFKTDAEREADRQERIQIVPAAEIFPYSRQPYTIDRPTPDLARLMDSIEHIGIAEPLIVRPRESGGYEIISGHRRDYCAKAVGLDTRPILVRNYSDEEADILVVDYNINREDLLPSEKAKAYKLKLDAMKRQGQRTDLTSGQLGQKLKGHSSIDLLADQVDESRKQVQRYVRLNTVTLGTDVFGNLQRMDNALEGLPIKEQACREQLSNLQTQLETAKAEVQKPFPREAELNTKTARLEELNTLLNLDHKEPEIVDAEPDEDQRPPERRRPQLER